MNDTSVQLQPGFILQHRKYRETSLILDVLTRDFGIVSILAKGVRKKKSKTAGLLLAFTALKISYLGKSELKILTHVELDISMLKLSGLSLYCGFYINELICHFLHKNDPNPEVFQIYRQCLVMLASTDKIEETLRFFELNLIERIGYGVSLTFDHQKNADVLQDAHYVYSGEKGMIEDSKGYITGQTLLRLENKNALDEASLSESKILMRQVIDFILQGKPLKSRAVLAKIINKL